MNNVRCPWASQNQLMKSYHDDEWGTPNHDERYLFEMLILEGHQAGLSWSIVLAKRKSMRMAYYNFDYNMLIKLKDEDIENYRNDDRVIKNRLKIKSVISNAKSYVKLIEKHGSLNHFLWSYVHYKPIINHWNNPEDVPVKTELSERISLDLKSLGFKFVGPVIIYSLMQAIGMVNDHLVSCFKHSKPIDVL